MNTNQLSPAQDGLPLPRRIWAVVAIATGITVSVLDGAIANVALPTIAQDLNTTPTYSIWVVNAYQLAMTISLLSFASIGEIWGYKKIYIMGLIIFSVMSLFCALSTSIIELTIARTLQGFGAAAVTSVNTSLLRIIYPSRYLAKGMGLNALIVSVSAAAGPTIASLILMVASWKWLFAVNIPVGIIAFWLSYKFLPDNVVYTPGRKFDVPGGLMNALTFALVIGVIEAFTHDWNIMIIIAIFVTMMISGFFFLRRERREKYPLFPVDLLKIPIFSLSVVTSIVSFIAQMLAMVSLPFLLQGAIGRSDVETGLLLTPWPLATMVFAPLAGILVSRINAGVLGGIGLTIFAGGLFLLGSLPENPHDFDIIWRMAICGAGFGLFQTPNNSTLISSAPASRSGGASGMLGMARLLGQTTGAALVALLFKVFPGDTHVSLYLGGGIAILAAIISLTRIGKTPATQSKVK